jgi:hypothetical protein
MRAGRGNSQDNPIGETPQGAPLPTLESPFSLTAAFKFGVIFLALRIAGTLAQRALGEAGFYAMSAVGGVVSSASAVASAANLAAAGTLPPQVAGIGAIIASATSALINLPLVARLAQDRALTPENRLGARWYRPARRRRLHYSNLVSLSFRVAIAWTIPASGESINRCAVSNRYRRDLHLDLIIASP